ncbi:aldehyde dehydrogenase (NADP(+)) [soil metagenome]
MELQGKHLIGGRPAAEASASTFQGAVAATGQPLDPPYHEATAAEVDRALRGAEASFDALRGSAPDVRADLLDRIADQIVALGDALLERAHLETGLPMARLTAERGRAVNQARLFAQLIREGSWVEARIDRGQPDRQPLPKPDVRRMLVPLGPIVVFGASNFPLAIGVVGTDTVCALASGCPVVVKGHPAHPGTAEMLGSAVGRALVAVGLPPQSFSLLHGAGHELGLALVRHPAARAVAFTGSLRGGRALYDAAAARPDPIPVYAEMGSTNPVFLLPGALEQRAEQIAEGFIGSVTMGVGQFCTNPGIVLGLEAPGLGRFLEAAGRLVDATAPGTMLYAGIQRTFDAGLQRVEGTQGVRTVGRSAAGTAGSAPQATAAVFATDPQTIEAQPHLKEELFGPSSIVVQCREIEEMMRYAESLEGQLTATLHGTEEDLRTYERLVRVLERKVGRLVFNGFPTGIEVCAAMHHGGPYPATTDPHFTSIGTASIHRFVRPVCYQGFPDAALPEELRNRNARGIWRLVDDQFTKDDA